MELYELTIKEAQEGLREKKFSSRELVESCLAQIKKLEPKLNAFITVCEKEALEEAERADEVLSQRPTTNDQRPLLGIPIALKDLYSTKDIRTTAASKVLSDYIPPYDATTVKKLKEAGGI